MANIDVNQIGARVASMEPSHGDASVVLQKSEITGKPEFVFSFKLPAGENGEDGRSIMGVVLTNENEWIPCLDDGTPDPDLRQHASTRILLKEGDTIIEDGVSYYIQTGDVPGEFTVDQYGDVNVTLTKESPENVEIICEAVYNGISHTKVFSVKKAIGTPVYKIVPDISAFKQVEGQTVAPGELRVDVIKWNGKNWVLANREKTVYYNFELIAPDPITGITGETKKVAEHYDYDSDTRTWFITLSNYSNWKSLELFIENEEEVIIDSQSVAILKDGIGVITAYAFTTVPSYMDLSDYTVTGGYYSTITDSNTYRSFKTIHSYSGEDLSATIEWKPTNANDHSDNEAVWMISQVFTSVDDSQEEEHTWSHPIRLADSDIFQVEYSSWENPSNVDEIIAPASLEWIKNRAIQNGVDEKTLDSETLETLWREYEESEGRIWGDDIENPRWMATAHFRNGRWTDWTVAKVRGDIGYNALKLELSNDSEFIPAIEEGGIWIPDPDLTPIASTFVELHDGHEAKIQSCKIKIECSDSSLGTMTDFSTSWPTEEIVMTNESDEVTWKFTREAELIVYKMSKDMMFTITAEYVNPRHSQPSQYSNSFKLRFAKNAIVYKIVPNVNVIKINSEGTAYPDNLAVAVRKWDGAKWTDVVLEEGQTILKYESDVDFPAGINVSYVDGQLIIPIENSAWGQQWPTEFNFETEIVTSDSKVLIGKETETVPVMWDGKHISTVDEYYCIVPDLVTPDVPSRSEVDQNPNQNSYTIGDITWTLVREGEAIPVATSTEPCLWNMELIYDSYGDCVIEPSAALVGRRGLDGLTPYKTFEYYATSSDILNSPEKENYTLKQTGVDLPRPDSENPYLWNFERVLYNKEGYVFSDEDIDVIKLPNFSENSLSDNGKLLIQDKFLRIDDTPEAIIGTVGAGSIYSNIYKRFAKGMSQKTADDIVVPAPECGSYKCPAPGYIGEPEGWDWLNWSDGIPARGIVYDFDGNLIENYNEREHGGALLYISTRIFTQDGDSPATATWKPAAPAIDGNGVDYEWCSLFLSKEEVGTPTTKPDNWSNIPSEQAVWMAVRTMGFDGAWTEWNVTTIMGEPGVHLELTNEHVMIPTTDDGATLLGDWDESSDDGIELAVTYAKVFNGSDEVKNLNGDNFATTLTFKGYVEGKGYEFLLESASTNISALNDSNEYNISVNYKGVHTKTLTVVKAKGSPVYRLVPSASEFIKDVNTNVMTPTSITFTVSKWNGQEWVEIANTSNSDASEKLAAENVSLTTLSLDNAGDVMLKSSNGIVLDREYIGCVTTGKNGEDAQHAGHIELSNDYETVFTDADGNLTSHSIMPSSTATFYYGDSQPSVTFDCTTISGQWEINENTVTLSSFSENSDEAVIEFVCQYAKVTYRKRFTVRKSRGNATWSLVLNPANIHLDADGNLKENIVCSIKCIKGENTEYIDAPNETCIVKKDGSAVTSWTFSDKNSFTLELYVKNSNGEEMLADKESVGVVVDGQTGPTGQTGPAGKSISEIKKQYQRHNIATSAPSGSWDDGMPSLTDDYPYMWCQETITYTDGTADLPFTYICAVKGMTGAAGKQGGTGKQGPVLYAAGIWNKYDGYELSDTRVPYVYLAGETDKTKCYWQLIKDVNASATGANKSPKEDSEHWKAMEYFESVYADAGAFNQALVGAFVFHGDNMYSQYFNGKDNDAYSSHASATIGSDGHVPNAWINAKDGTAWFSNGKAKFNKNGTWHLGDNSKYIEYDGNGKVTLSGITISYDQIDKDAKDSLKSDAQSGMVSDSNFNTKFNTQFETKGVVTDSNFNTKFAGQVTAKGLIDSTTLDGKGFQTATQVGSIIDGKGFQNATQVGKLIDDKKLLPIAQFDTTLSGSTSFKTLDGSVSGLGTRLGQAETSITGLDKTVKDLRDTITEQNEIITEIGRNYIKTSDLSSLVITSENAQFGRKQRIYKSGVINSEEWIYPMVVDATGNLTFNTFETDKTIQGSTFPYKRINNILKIGKDGLSITGSVSGQGISGYPLTESNTTGSWTSTLSISSSLHVNPNWNSNQTGAKVYEATHTVNLDNFVVKSGATITTTKSVSATLGFFQTSDERLKTFTSPIEVDFDKLKTIPKSYFNWNSGSGGLQLGTSAQKVQAIYPEIVNVEDDKLSVDYARLSVVALAAIDKLHEENEELKEELNNLKNFVYGNK